MTAVETSSNVPEQEKIIRPFELQTPYEFLGDFVTLCQKAEKRIWVQTFQFRASHGTNLMVNSMAEAARRGVDVQFGIDWYSQNLFKKEQILPQKFNNQTFQRIKELQGAGSIVFQTNEPNLLGKKLKYLGRNHAKITIVDDVAWIGSMNLSQHHFNDSEIMVKISSRDFVDQICRAFNLMQNGIDADLGFFIKDQGAILIDSSKKGYSLIYNQARGLVWGAKEITLVSQYVPSFGFLDDLVEEAGWGSKVTFITSNKDDYRLTGFGNKYFYDRMIKKTKKFPNFKVIHSKGPVHAKLLMVDGEKAIFGSHNFTYLTVLAGTGELSIQTKDSYLLGQFEVFRDKLINQAG